MPADPDLASLLLYGAVLGLAGLVHGTLGLGFPLVATPLLALTLDIRSAILVTLLPTAAVNIASIVRGGKWRESIGRFWPLALFAVAGAALGSRWLVVADPAPFKLLLASLVMLYLVVSASGEPRLPWVARHPGLSMLAFGLVAGVAAGTTNVMVPILIVFALEVGLGRTAMVQVFNLCFLAGKLTQIVVFSASGLVTGAVLMATAPLAVVALAALAAGMVVRERIPTAAYRRIVRHVLALLALVLVAQYFWR